MEEVRIDLKVSKSRQTESDDTLKLANLYIKEMKLEDGKLKTH